MSDHHRTGRLNRRTAKRLLDGADGHARLHAVLTAAAAPALPEELAGEDAAVAAFRAAPRPARKHRAATLRRFLTVKALVLVGGSLILTGGAAYATITGNFPGGSPAPSPTPTLHERTGTGQDNTPVTQFSPSAPPSTPKPNTSRSPHTSKTPPGRTRAPSQQNKTTTPRQTPTSPRGPDNHNGTTPPTGRPGTGTGTGTGSGSGAGSGSGNDTGDAKSGSPRGGSDIGRPD